MLPVDVIGIHCLQNYHISVPIFQIGCHSFLYCDYLVLVNIMILGNEIIQKLWPVFLLGFDPGFHETNNPAHEPIKDRVLRVVLFEDVKSS